MPRRAALPDRQISSLRLHILGLNLNDVLEISGLAQFLYMMMSGSDVLLGEAFQLLTKIRSTPSGGHVLLKKIEVVFHCPLGLLHSLLDSLLRLNVEILQRASVFCHDSSPDYRKS